MVSSGVSSAFSPQVALQLTPALAKGHYAVEDFRCQESLSAPFEMEVMVTSDNLQVDLNQVMGKSLTVTVIAKPKRRFFNGIVGSISQKEFTDHGRTCTYLLKLYPRLWLLKFSKDFKIFQNKSVQTIVKEVLQSQGVKHVQDRTQRYGRALRDYCVQYGESHFDFISRLMEEEGIFYYFEHAKDNHTLVLGDQPSAHGDCSEMPKIDVDFSRPQKPFLNVVTQCFLDHCVIAQEHSLTDYNYMTPKTNLFAKAKGAGQGKEMYHYPGVPENDFKPKKSHSEAVSRLHAEREDVTQQVLWGHSTCAFFSAGQAFTLQKHLRREANQRYVLKSLEHHITLLRSPQNSGDQKNSEDFPEAPQVICTNRFFAFPAKIPFRPPCVTPKPVIHGTQTAVVTGPPGEEIYTDDHRRIKIQFPWDRLGSKDDKTSCWVRVVQSWASNNWGILFTPRIGMEVVVSFINGDPDRPLVTGCVYNADNLPPYGAKDKTKSTLKSHTHKGQGFNEFRFEDEKQKEEIYLHAQKDWNTFIIENRTSVIEKGSDVKVLTKGDREVVLKGEPGVIPQRGKAPSLDHQGTAASKKGDDYLTLERGTRVVKFLAMGAQKGSYISVLSRGDRELTILKGDNNETYLKGNDTKTITQGNRVVFIGQGDDTETIAQGNKSLTVGKGHRTTTLTAGNSMLLIPAGMMTALMQGLLVKVGNTVLTVGSGSGGTTQKASDPRRDIGLTSPGGDVVLKFSKGDLTYEQQGHKKCNVTKDSKETVGGRYILEVDKDILITCKGDIKIQSQGSIHMKAGKEFKVEAGSISMHAQQSYSVQAMSMKCSLSMSIDLSATMIAIKGAAMTTIKGAMLKLNS